MIILVSIILRIMVWKVEFFSSDSSNRIGLSLLWHHFKKIYNMIICNLFLVNSYLRVVGKCWEATSNQWNSWSYTYNVFLDKELILVINKMVTFQIYINVCQLLSRFPLEHLDVSFQSNIRFFVQLVFITSYCFFD